MLVYVKVFATLREYMDPKPEIGIKTEMKMEEGSIISDIIDLIKLPRDEVKIIFRNNSHAKVEDRLENDDVIAFFPAVGGG
jgi:molybdopterin converting factor small subunit